VAASLRPVTERILERLPGRRLVWIALWALVPWLNAGANLLFEPERRSSVWDQSDRLVVLSYAVFSAAVVITLSGSERVASRLETLRTTTANVLEGDSREPFREVNSTWGPLLLAAATAIAFGVTALVVNGWAAGLVRGVTWFVLGIPL
jgi:hypothetical protein